MKNQENKNPKEEKSKIPDELNIPCCINCKLHIKCEKRKQYQREHGLDSRSGAYEFSIDRWNKEAELDHECTCSDFTSRWIEYPILVSKIEHDNLDYSRGMHEIGSLVSIRPCGEEYEKKTYLGIYLGDLPRNTHISHKSGSDHSLNISYMTNPAIFVPDLRKIIFGDESWWSIIESEEQLSEITDEDINNTWYVKLLRGKDE